MRRLRGSGSDSDTARTVAAAGERPAAAAAVGAADGGGGCRGPHRSGAGGENHGASGGGRGAIRGGAWFRPCGVSRVWSRSAREKTLERGAGPRGVRYPASAGER